MIYDTDTPPSHVVLGSAYRTSKGDVFVWDAAIGDSEPKWRPAKVVYTVFGVAPESADLDLAEHPSPSKVNEGKRLHWKENAIALEDAWPDGEVTHGIGSMSLRMSTHGDDPTSYLLEVAGWNLKTVEQRWRHIAQTLVPAQLWRELEPIA